MRKVPRFAVVGHPNKGKSSIVSTLAHNDGVEISALSGTTVIANEYPYSIDGKQHYVLIDTPGFQRPRQVLNWLNNFANDASQRHNAIEQFVETHREMASATGKFRDEVELLSPVVEGAGIIYVVDGSVPYRPEYEAEMTILQWTGQPRMALINPIGSEAYVEEWRQALGQFFSLVKVFNPMTAGIQKQLSVLAAFAELNNTWRKSLENSIVEINEQKRNTKKQAAFIIADLMSELLSCQFAAPMPDETVAVTIEKTLKARYQKTLRAKEKSTRQRLVELYSFYHLQWEEADFEAEYPDMFDSDHWYLFGLSRQKLVGLAASAGAAAGAIVDLSVGAVSLMTGAVTGGLLGGVTSLFLSAKPDQIKIKGVPLGGKQLVIGPIKDAQFAFVLLGRMVTSHAAISGRSHADQSRLVLESEDSQHWIEVLDKKTQVSLARLLQKASKGLGAVDLRALQAIIERVL